MATKTKSPSGSSGLQEEENKLQVPRPQSSNPTVQGTSTNTMNANEANPIRALGGKGIDDGSGLSSPTRPVLDGDDVNHQPDDLIDSLGENKVAERLESLGDILDVIDPLVPLPDTETFEPLSQYTLESHAELAKVNQTVHDSVYLRCRGGLADSTSHVNDEDYFTDSAGDPDEVNIEDRGDPDLAHFVEYSPYPSPDPSEHERNEYPWRTWSKDSTLNESPSIHEDNVSQHSQDTNYTHFISDDDEGEEQQGQLPRARAVEGVPEREVSRTRDEARGRSEEYMDRTRRVREAEERGEGPMHSAPNARRLRHERRLNAFLSEQYDDERDTEDLEQGLRRSLGLDNPSGRVISIAHMMEIIAEEDRERMAYPEPPAPPYNRYQDPDQPTNPPAQPPRSTQARNLSQSQPPENLHVFQRQTPTHVLQSLADIGEDGLRSLPTAVLALLGGAEVVGRVMVREVREVARYLLQRREELQTRESRED